MRCHFVQCSSYSAENATTFKPLYEFSVTDRSPVIIIFTYTPKGVLNERRRQYQISANSLSISFRFVDGLFDDRRFDSVRNYTADGRFSDIGPFARSIIVIICHLPRTRVSAGNDESKSATTTPSRAVVFPTLNKLRRFVKIQLRRPLRKLIRKYISIQQYTKRYGKEKKRHAYNK